MAAIPTSVNLRPTSSVPQALRSATPIAAQESDEQPADSVSLAGKVDTPGIYSLKDVAGFRPGSALDTSALKGNLKERIHGIQTDAVKDAGSRFQQTNFGSVVSSGGTGKFGELENMSGSRSKNPLDNQGSGMRTSRNDMVSDEPSNSGSNWQAFKEFASSVIGSVLGGAGTRSAAGGAAGATAGTASGTAWSVLTANTDSPDDKKNEFNGYLGLVRQGRTGTSNENAAAMMQAAMQDMEPVPDDISPSAHSFTPGNFNRTKGTSNPYSEPTDDGTRGGGGPINTGANGTGRQSSQAQPIDDLGPSFAVTQFDSKGIEARLTSRINIVR